MAPAALRPGQRAATRLARSAVAGLAAWCFATNPSPAQPDTVAPDRFWVCHGVLSFGDALGRAVRMRVDFARHEVTTPDCHKYPHLARFCVGTLIRFAPHQFAFNGTVSPQNAEFWADLQRPSQLLTIEADGTNVETMRVLFLGRCVPAR